MVSVAEAFGEVFLYYARINRVTGTSQNKVAFVEWVMVYGVPALIGAAYPASEHSSGSGGREPGESGTRYGLSETAREVRAGVVVSIRYDSASSRFIGTVTNATDQAVSQVRVEIHLSSGVELGPTPATLLGARQSSSIVLDAGSQRFSGFSTHVEIGSGEHGGEGGGGTESGSEGREGGAGQGGGQGRKGGENHGRGETGGEDGQEGDREGGGG